MKTLLYTTLIALIFTATQVSAQNNGVWNGKQCAVVLTYDDAVNQQLDNAIPALDSLNLKATFYLIGASKSVNKRMKDWRAVASRGHELGNHTMFHPCDGGLPNRDFVTVDDDLRKYTPSRAAAEIHATNILLKAIDGKHKRTFAFPCGDETINGVPFYDTLRKYFVAARGTTPGMQTADKVNLNDIQCYGISGQNASYMIDLVNKAMRTHTLLVFMFHGVGGGHNLNVDVNEHSKLLHYLKKNETKIWIAPMIDVAQRIAEYQKSLGTTVANNK